MSDIPTSYLDFCTTEHQKLCVKAWIDAGFDLPTAVRKSKIPYKSLRDAVYAINTKAQSANFAPEYGLNKPLPDYLRLKGISEYQDAEGIRSKSLSRTMGLKNSWRWNF